MKPDEGEFPIAGKAEASEWDAVRPTCNLDKVQLHNVHLVTLPLHFSNWVLSNDPYI